MQPFNMKSVYSILLAGMCYIITYYAFLSMHHLEGMIVKSVTFIILYVSGILYFRLTPDVLPVWKVVLKKFSSKKR